MNYTWCLSLKKSKLSQVKSRKLQFALKQLTMWMYIMWKTTHPYRTIQFKQAIDFCKTFFFLLKSGFMVVQWMGRHFASILPAAIYFLPLKKILKIFIAFMHHTAFPDGELNWKWNLSMISAILTCRTQELHGLPLPWLVSLFVILLDSNKPLKTLKYKLSILRTSYNPASKNHIYPFKWHVNKILHKTW